MTRQAMLADLIRETVEVVKQEGEQGLESFYMPAGLEAALPMPEPARRSGPDGRRSGPDAPAASLEALYEQYHRCTACALGHRRKHFVFGSGNENADVMFVGEAPGAQEDEQGQPFVGAAGQLLTRILNAIDFTRDEVYITNILKCRPPNNRDPQPDEIDACDAILKEQIRLVRPRLICALGRVAAQALLKQNSSIRTLRGRFHDYHGVKLLVTYHPSGLLRNAAYKRPTWEDVQMLRKEYDRIVQSDAKAT